MLVVGVVAVFCVSFWFFVFDRLVVIVAGVIGGGSVVVAVVIVAVVIDRLIVVLPLFQFLSFSVIAS